MHHLFVGLICRRCPRRLNEIELRNAPHGAERAWKSTNRTQQCPAAEWSGQLRCHWKLSSFLFSRVLEHWGLGSSSGLHFSRQAAWEIAPRSHPQNSRAGGCKTSVEPTQMKEPLPWATSHPAACPFYNNLGHVVPYKPNSLERTVKLFGSSSNREI